MENEKNTTGVSSGQNITPISKPSGSQDFESLSDENLYQLCQTYGERARFWRQKFAGLLPEVFKRKLYQKKGFSSVFEFSKKLAGMSEEQVRLVLNLEKRFEKTPVLKSLLVEGKVSVNKLARIVSIANPENEIFLANQVQILSKSAVETLVRDEKFWGKSEMENGKKSNERNVTWNMNRENQNGSQKSFFEGESLPGQTFVGGVVACGVTGKIGQSSTLHLSPEVQQKLFDLQQKGIDINYLLLEFLQKHEQEIAERKEEISRKILEREEEKPATKRIPVSAKKILSEEYGKKCSIKNCKKEAVQIHHTQRFFASQSHDPRYLAPLCREHHELAHSADIAYHEVRQRIKQR